MPTLDELKKQIKEEASDNPDKFFATDVLRDEGFNRSRCSNCGVYFWSFNERDVCGEPECGDGYTFINDSPTSESFSYTEAWNAFRDHMEDRGYSSIDRYPVVARWRDDVEFTGASIYCFQPYVVSGEAEPPAKELVIPQPSLRFNDVDNVGITGRHYTNFVMIGQLAFRPREEYDQDRYFKDMFDFAVDVLGIPKEDLVLHEDAWGGGGNLGACMEFFVDGLELWNQVYMFYEVTSDGYKELDLSVLDMGMGHERIAWISQGTETSYECVMPSVLENMKEEIGLETDQDIWEQFLPYSGELNVDEVEDIDAKWDEISSEIGIDTKDLKDEIKPAAGLYSVAEHTRALLFALADGKLPSNTGGGHNLRLVYRRAKDFIERYDWSIELGDVVEWHAEELKPIFPELEKKLPEVKKILDVEAEKYEKARRNALKQLESWDEQPSVDDMVELYESHGVSPEMMEEAGFKVPEDFYAHVTSEDEVVEEAVDRFDLDGVPGTELLYYEDEREKEMSAVVVETVDDWVALDRTVFYPEGGGQVNDTGIINGEKVTDVQKQGDIVLHKVPGHSFEKGTAVDAVVDWERRYQLMQNHTATHIVNGAVKQFFGNHIWQAGSKKTEEKARLDVTHYENIDRDTLDRLEQDIRKVVLDDIDVSKTVLSKSEAERRFGFRIYQGGAPPGDEVRIVEVDGFDIEACGGTHVSASSEVEEFVFTGSRKVQDGVIRLEYKAGDAAFDYIEGIRERVETVSDMLGVESPDNHRKAQRKLVDIFSVEAEQLERTVESFREDLDLLRQKILRLSDYMDQDVEMPRVEGETVVEKSRSIFETRKNREKVLEGLENDIETEIGERMTDRVIEEEVPTENIGLLIQVSRKLAKDYQASVTLKGLKGAVSASYHEEFDADENLEKYSSNVQGDNNFAKTFDI